MTEPLRKDFKFLIKSVVDVYEKWLFQDDNIFESWKIFSDPHSEILSDIKNIITDEFNDGNLSIKKMLEISVRIFDKKFGNPGFLKLFSEKKYLDLIDQDQVNIHQKIFEEKQFLEKTFCFHILGDQFKSRRITQLYI